MAVSCLSSKSANASPALVGAVLGYLVWMGPKNEYGDAVGSSCFARFAGTE